MKLIDGRKTANKILSELEQRIKSMAAKPCLGVVLVGNNPASRLYVRLKKKAAKKIGIKIKEYALSQKAAEKDILRKIGLLNNDRHVHGILVQMPLPGHVSANEVIQAIDPEKDVDGFLPESKFSPPFIFAIWKALEQTGGDLKDKKIIALVNSDTFGQALVKFFREKSITVRYFTSAFNPDILKSADVIITALGLPQFIKGEMIKKGAVLIDGGISRVNNKVVGDIDAKSVSEKAAWLSPVPGGVGPLTVALLLKNVVLAAEK